MKLHGTSPWHLPKFHINLLGSNHRENHGARSWHPCRHQKTFKSAKLVELFRALKSITVGVDTARLLIESGNSRQR